MTQNTAPEDKESVLSLIYVSHSLLAPTDRVEFLSDIQTASIERNSTLNITGLLIATPNHFAQLLEGPEIGVKEIMRSIVADVRHEDVRIVRQGPSSGRRCPYWRMQSIDAGSFANARITPILASLHAKGDERSLHKLDWLINQILSRDGLSSK